eukprot:gene304-62_t
MAASRALVLVALARAAEAARPTNFVYILADDLGNNDLSIYGHPTIHTPHLDQMAAEGALFTQAYAAAPICTPSRASFFTGRLPVRNGMYNNGTAARDAWERKDGLGGLPASELTLATLRRTARTRKLTQTKRASAMNGLIANFSQNHDIYADTTDMAIFFD